jgi:alpha-N-acetylglucosaminidase
MIRLPVMLAVLAGGFQAIAAVPSHVHDPVGSVQALIGRLLGPTYMSAFQLEVIPADPATGHDVFELDSDSDSSDSVSGSPSVIVRGNTGVAVAAGLHWYLKYECNASIAWGKGSSGNQLATVPAPAQLPKPALRRNVSPVRLRYAYNVSETLWGLGMCTAKT